jgi:hypothetical protein
MPSTFLKVKGSWKDTILLSVLIVMVRLSEKLLYIHSYQTGKSQRHLISRAALRLLRAAAADQGQMATAAA